MYTLFSFIRQPRLLLGHSFFGLQPLQFYLKNIPEPAQDGCHSLPCVASALFMRLQPCGSPVCESLSPSPSYLAWVFLNITQSRFLLPFYLLQHMCLNTCIPACPYMHAHENLNQKSGTFRVKSMPLGLVSRGLHLPAPP